MRRNGLLLLLLSLLCTVPVQSLTNAYFNASICPSVLVSQLYWDGYNRVIELFNYGNTTVNFNVENMSVGEWRNANRQGFLTNGTADGSVTLTGTAAAGAVFLVGYRDGASVLLDASVWGGYPLPIVMSVSTQAFQFDGDDTVALRISREGVTYLCDVAAVATRPVGVFSFHRLWTVAGVSEVYDNDFSLGWSAFLTPFQARASVTRAPAYVGHHSMFRVGLVAVFATFNSTILQDTLQQLTLLDPDASLASAMGGQRLMRMESRYLNTAHTWAQTNQGPLVVRTNIDFGGAPPGITRGSSTGNIFGAFVPLVTTKIGFYARGYISPALPGLYEFTVRSGDGSVFYIDSNRNGVIDAADLKCDQSALLGTAMSYWAAPKINVTFAAGEFLAFSLGFFQDVNTQQLTLYWRRPLATSSPALAPEPVPEGAFYYLGQTCTGAPATVGNATMGPCGYAPTATRCTVTCLANYAKVPDVNGNLDAMCYDGVWSVPSCKPVLCAVNPTPPSNGSYPNCSPAMSGSGVCPLTCTSGYLKTGDSQCVNGNWTRPGCSPDRCAAVPASVENAYPYPLSCANTADGGTCTLDCLAGFDKSGNAVCRLGEWSQQTCILRPVLCYYPCRLCLVLPTQCFDCYDNATLNDNTFTCVLKTPGAEPASVSVPLIVGVAVGASVVCVALALLFVCVRRRRRSGLKSLRSSSMTGAGGGVGAGGAGGSGGAGVGALSLSVVPPLRSNLAADSDDVLLPTPTNNNRRVSSNSNAHGRKVSRSASRGGRHSRNHSTRSDASESSVGVGGAKHTPRHTPHSSMKLESMPISLQHVDWSDIHIQDQIGEGLSFLLHRGTWSGTEIAVKVPRSQTEKRVVEDLEREMDMSIYVGAHPRVVQFLGVCKEVPAKFAMLYTLYDGTVEQMLITNQPPAFLIDRSVASAQCLRNLIIILQMAVDASSGVVHLHSKRILHRDIAARNFFVDSRQRVSVGNFGLSIQLEESESVHQSVPTERLAIKWCAPEVIKSGSHSVYSDVYSFGVFLYEIIARQPPFPEMKGSELSASVRDKTPASSEKQPLQPTIPDYCPKELRALIRDCWALDAERRPSMRMVNSRLQSFLTRCNSASTIEDVYQLPSLTPVLRRTPTYAITYVGVDL